MGIGWNGAGSLTTRDSSVSYRHLLVCYELSSVRNWSLDGDSTYIDEIAPDFSFSLRVNAFR